MSENLPDKISNKMSENMPNKISNIIPDKIL